MDNGKKQQAIFYVEGNKLTFYPGQGGTLAQVAIPPELMSDLEVLNAQKFIEFVTAFFQSQKIPASDILFVFAQAATFEKEFAETEKKEAQEQFLEFIPFDNILSKTLVENKKTRIVAVNAQLYALLKEGSEKVGSTVAGVVAYSSLLGMLPSLKQKVDIQLMLTKFDSCKQFSMTAVSKTVEKTEEEQTPSEKPKDKKVYLLLGVFGVLVGILLIMIVTTMTPAKPKPPIQVPRTLPVVTPTSIPTTVTAPATRSAEVIAKPIQAQTTTAPVKIQGQ